MTEMDVDFAEDEKMIEKLGDVSLGAEEESKLRGSGMFGFHTPKTCRNMLLKAFDSAGTASVSSPSKKSGGKTPKARGKGRATRTPQKGRQGTTPRGKATSDTPRRLQSRNAKAADSSSEDSFEEEEEEEEELASPLKANSDPNYKNKLCSAVEEYFLLHGAAPKTGTGPRTSNRTLARLGATRPDALEVRQLLAAFYASKPANCYVAERRELLKDYKRLFPKWGVYLKEDFNVLLYGVGSKADLLDQFCSEWLSEEDHLIVRGFMPNVTIRAVLKTICEQFVDPKMANKQVPDQMDAIREVFNDEKSADLYLVVHNIDGPLFRNDKAQSVFCGLAACARIHILASVDHINAPLLWSAHQLGQLAWLWHDCTTFAPYLEETAFENSLLIQQGGALVLSSLRHVMASLTSNAREIFLMIANHQLEEVAERGASSFEGYSLDELYWRCRDACLVNNDVTLRAQLTEFKDHKLIRFKKALDGTELALIPLDESSLRDFVSNFADYVR